MLGVRLREMSTNSPLKSRRRHWESFISSTKKTSPKKTRRGAVEENEISRDSPSKKKKSDGGKSTKSHKKSKSMEVKKRDKAIKKSKSSKKSATLKNEKKKMKDSFEHQDSPSDSPLVEAFESIDVVDPYFRDRYSKEKEELCSSSSAFAYDEEEDGEGEDFIGDFVFEEDHPDKAFVCLKEQDIVTEQNREIQHISELLSLSQPQCSGLLRYFKWNKDKLLTRYFEDPDGVLELAGVKVKTGGSGDSQGVQIITVDNRCSICDEEGGDAVELFAIECKHYFCFLCWNQYLTMQIREGQSGLIPCPSYDCGLLVEEQFVKKMVTEEIYVKYQSFLAKSFVDGNSQVRWCPAPGCGNAVNTDAPVGQTVHCACGYSFCFRCGEESHGPAYCEHVRDWNQKSRDESETNHWINANTQACPKCHSSTEKNGGCNHMTCRNCSYDYCWMCKKEWKGHYDFYTCNRFEKKSKKSKKPGSGKKKSKVDKETQAALEKEEHRQRLERYLLYYNQFIEHDKMVAGVSKMREEINLKLQEWRENDGTVAESLFVEKALSVLGACYRALKWSCVRLYYFDDQNIRKNLFEFVRNDLEKSVVQLADVLKDSPFEKMEVLDSTRLCETRITNLLSWHNTCR